MLFRSLSNKQKALIATFGMFAFAIIAGLGIDFIARNVSVEVLGYVGGAIVFLFFVNLTYQMFLARFEYEEKVQNLIDK